MAHYQRLSALDACFLAIEDDASHMHVAATLLFENGPLQSPHGGLDMERIRAYIESRLHRVRRYRQRLGHIPILRHPVWVDDRSFNLFYHVRHTALPRPGELRQLKRLCGRILSQKLDVTKPLWEMWIVEGVEDDRFALVVKVHHSMADGLSGIDLLIALLSPSADPDFEPGPRWRPRPAPGAIELLADEALRRAALPLQATRAIARALQTPLESFKAVRATAWGVLEQLVGASNPASSTPLNPPIGPHRRFDWLRLDLGTVKAVKQALGGTVNDVVLATVVGAARRFLTGRGVRPEGLDFRAAIPVNVRPGTERGRLGNRIAQVVARMPIGERDPASRYGRILEVTAALKRSQQIHGAEILEDLGDWTATGVLAELIRFAARRRAYNVIVTNVPGPTMPLYMLGAPLRETYPMVPLFHNQAVGIGLFSYAGGLFFGLNADWDSMPDLHDLVVALEEEFATLLRLATPEALAVPGMIARS